MHSTRPAPEARIHGAVIAACGVLFYPLASCSTDDVRPGFAEFDASADTAPRDADVETAPPSEGPSHDAAVLNLHPPPIVCASNSCALSLTSISTKTSQTFCALLHDGTAACWGANDAGQLGRGDDDGGTPFSAIPMRVTGLSNIVMLNRTCAVDGDGSIYCWGTGPHPSGDAGPITTERTPVKLPIERAKKVSATDRVGCAILDEGVACWGSNYDAQIAPLDYNNNRQWYYPPHAVALPPGAKPYDIAVGEASFVVLDDGTIISWGATPPLGRLTSLSPDALPQPIVIAGTATAIDVDGDNACAAAAGVGYCWGAGPPRRAYLDLSRALPTAIVTPEPVRQVSTVRQYTYLGTGEYIAMPDRWCAVGVSGDVYCCGYNASGQAGDGTKEHAYDTVKVKGLPAPAVEVKVVLDATCALLTTGRIYCWGSDFYGQLGTGQLKASSLIPQEVLLP